MSAVWNLEVLFLLLFYFLASMGRLVSELYFLASKGGLAPDSSLSVFLVSEKLASQHSTLRVSQFVALKFQVCWRHLLHLRVMRSVSHWNKGI